jgi:hypothetical protein
MNRRLTERFVGADVGLLSKMSLEADRLLVVEDPETLEAGIGLEAVKRLGGGIDRWLAPALGLPSNRRSSGA